MTHFFLVISNYCIAAPNNTVSNSLVEGTYGMELGNSSVIGCTHGYSANGSSSIATCIHYNDTHGTWSGLNLTCARVLNFISNKKQLILI